MQAVSSGVKAAVQNDGSRGQASGEGVTVSCVMNKASRLEVGENVHNDSVPRSGP